MRLPIDRAGRHVIALYDEVPVVVVPAESDLTAADELEAADLAGEVLITPADDVLGFTASGTREPSFAAPETTEDAVATVGAGVGVVIVPMSLARSASPQGRHLPAAARRTDLHRRARVGRRPPLGPDRRLRRDRARPHREFVALRRGHAPGAASALRLGRCAPSLRDLSDTRSPSERGTDVKPRPTPGPSSRSLALPRSGTCPTPGPRASAGRPFVSVAALPHSGTSPTPGP
ncbi:hypothetical protein [Microbacterium elymi]|uniref:LysR substrate-binding domain-containing protein n=1 Tax=Microbacterium elymi TaxID=2909587 RepID=A0ABY5NLH0_9MICO|nr:hypothetical protein [Microbacterium elymi]UUT35987.1 hypothetical protein L2X98_23025 [Microbacterium elymi]